ncbi:hypothetical protein QUF64_10675 [Anaerolineales bacterium HSG6]|nr:hypothetical protein [Anaerolineales bacterium HSG6]MDM8529748.1 hypothetical protein [Anaerolineales bacterium HSG25]
MSKSKSRNKKRTKLDPNRFKKKSELDDLGIFAFDPIRQKVFIWGLIGGLIGSIFTAQPEFWARMFGLVIMVLPANYQIGIASKQIPRWHAAAMALLGLLLAIPFSTAVNALVLMTMAYYQGTL